MNREIISLLSKYKINSLLSLKNALREVVQELVLSSLSHVGFFNEAALYGGTALRIFYGLDRFSEDLDFSLIDIKKDFDINEYISPLQSELDKYGLELNVIKKDKSASTDVASLFIEANLRRLVYLIYDVDVSIINHNENLKIKIDVDTNPPLGATYEIREPLTPFLYPYSATIFDFSSLLAGKISALLSRGWKNRVKGRDFYDYIFLLSIDNKVNLLHLENRLVKSNYISSISSFDIDVLKDLLNKRFSEIDFTQALNEVFPFLINPTSSLETVFTKDYFISVSNALIAV